MAQDQNQGTLVNVKRVRKDQDTKGREKIVLTFGLDQNGSNGLDALLAALETYRGKQVNFDIRLEEKTSDRGAKFMTSFVIVKEMIPKGAETSGGQVKYVPKQSRQDEVKARSEKIRQQFGE